MPAVASLRAHYADAHIAWLVERRARGALVGQPVVDEVIEFPRDALSASLRALRLSALAREFARFARELRSRDFDLVVDFHAILKSGLLGWLSGAPERASYARPFGRETSWLLANRRARIATPSLSRYERNAALVQFLGIRRHREESVGLRVEPEALARMSRHQGDQARAVVHPGSSPGTPYKRYPAPGYAAVIRALAEQEGLRSWVAYGTAEGERELAERVAALAGDAADVAPETPSLSDLAALFACARVFIGSDSGPLHVASLVGTPVVQLLGPTDPVENEPYRGTPSRTLRVPVGCSPCRSGCADAPCMSLVSPERIVAAARELLTVAPPASRQRRLKSSTSSDGALRFVAS